MLSHRRPLLLLLLLASLGAAQRCPAEGEKPLLLQKPAVSQTQICFSCAGDLWTVPREGGDARRLTVGVGIETDPQFSPDGQWVAFTGEYDGNVDVYAVPAAGGVPRRLTYHPAADQVVGWTKDGKSILFRSSRNSYSGFQRLFTVPLAGGFPTEIPLPMATEGSYSPDGTRLAYVPTMQVQRAWKRYRGGQTKPIWIADLADSSIRDKIPRENSNDFRPMWVGRQIYFLSDRNGPVSLFCYDTVTKKVTQIVQNDGLDIKSASAGPGAIVYEQFGSLHLYDLNTGRAHPVPVRIAGDMPEVRPHFVKVARSIRNVDLSPTGARAVFEARGEILTVPAEKGDIRNLTNTPGVAERDPSWSPDGKSIAYFSDESGEYALHIRSQNGMGETRKFDLGERSFFYNPTWSPDSKKIAYADKRLNLWYIDLDKKTPVRVDTDTYDGGPISPAWSPDGRWLTYARQLKSHMHAVFLYSLDTGKTTQITDGMSDAVMPVFDKNGRYLYFAASTDVGLRLAGGDLSGTDHPLTRSVYVVVLRSDLPSPLAPESDEEKEAEKPKDADSAPTSSAGRVPTEGGREEGKAAKPEENKAAKPGEKKEEPVRIDLDQIGQRILALPMPARTYVSLEAGKTGVLFLREVPAVALSPADFGRGTLHKFDLATRKTETMIDGIQGAIVSRSGEKLLYRQGENWAIVPTAAPVKPGEGVLKLADMEVAVDPHAEWNQMYHEVWRIERDFFYDPGFHGLNLAAAERKYSPWLDNLCSRADLNYLFEEMLGEMTVGHMFVFGGDFPETRKATVGLLGADYRIENRRYRFARVYNGENWNPELRAPLTQPGVNVKAGEYLLAVNGRDVPGSDNLYRFFEETAGKQTVLKVGPNANGDGAREVTVVPVENEGALRNLAWIEDNRRTVDRLSGGRLAYVYVPDTARGGYTSFNRYYFAQTDKEGVVIDERFNGGGNLADYIVDYLDRPILNRVMTREGSDWSEPVGAIYGPKAMIINEMAGSGGDALPWYFRKRSIGPIIGKRTWGGLVGIGGYPSLMDGGGVMAPRMAIYGLKGEWEVENHGVAPDIEVDLDPHAWRMGHDPQLETAVSVVMQQLKEHPQPSYPRPNYVDYHQRL
jgi:tricorn protease